jgi:hypothetical protein
MCGIDKGFDEGVEGQCVWIDKVIDKVAKVLVLGEVPYR